MIETTSRIRNERARQRIRDFLHGRDRGPLVSIYHDPVYRQEPDPEKFVARACEVIRADMESGEPDIVPTFSPDFGTISTAAMYGGLRIPAVGGGGIHIEPVTDSVEDLLKLQPCRFEDSDYQRAIDLYGEVRARLGTDDVAVRTPDFQGPLNTLALLIEQTDLMVAMLEQPDLIKTVLDRITNTLIEYNARFRDAVGPANVVGNLWPYIVLPDGVGASVTLDYMPLLSPGEYAAFELPLLKRIADRFGGVFIHCCGQYARHLPALAQSGVKIWGLEVHHADTRVEDVYAMFGDRVAITPYVLPTARQEFPTLAALVRSWRGKPHARGRFWFATCAEWGDSLELRDAVAETCI